MATVADKVAAWLERQGRPRTGEPIVVGCSGGADSTSLLLALAACARGPLHAIHVDHGLRLGSAEEGCFVEEAARRAGASFASRRVIVERRGNLLDSARRARYAALVEEARSRACRFVAVGHTATDQAETLVMHACRGDLRESLAGMSERRVLDGEIELIRPLLEVGRGEAREWLAGLEVRWVDDPSNERDDLLRGRVRRGLAPIHVERELLSLAATVRSWRGACETAAASLGPLDALPVASLAGAEDGVLLALLRRAGAHHAGRAQVAGLRRLLGSTAGCKGIPLGDGLVAERSYRLLRLGPPSPPVVDHEVPIDGPGRYPFPGGAVVVDGDPPPGLVLRNLRPGDRVQTIVGRRKLQDLFTDWKVPRHRRRRVPLLARGGEVAWLGLPRALASFLVVPPVGWSASYRPVAQGDAAPSS